MNRSLCSQGVLIFVTCPRCSSQRNTRGMLRGCVLCHGKRLILFSCKQQPLRHQLPSVVTSQNSRIHHSKQIFIGKIDRRIDLFCLLSGRWLPSIVHAVKVVSQIKTIGSPQHITQNMRNQFAFLSMNTQKEKKIFFELTFMMSTINLHTSNSILSKQHYAKILGCDKY